MGDQILVNLDEGHVDKVIFRSQGAEEGVLYVIPCLEETVRKVG
jgi:hypothetical protein